jgi:hypothetical protein
MSIIAQVDGSGMPAVGGRAANWSFRTTPKCAARPAPNLLGLPLTDTAAATVVYTHPPVFVFVVEALLLGEQIRAPRLGLVGGRRPGHDERRRECFRGDRAGGGDTEAGRDCDGQGSDGQESRMTSSSACPFWLVQSDFGNSERVVHGVMARSSVGCD